jgi:hypothetical protein
MPVKGVAYNLETTLRQPLTKQNLEELGIDKSILDHPSLVYTDAKGAKQKPIGFSINEAVFGVFPGTAAERGWITYMTLGEPLIEERSNIKQPDPDTLSSRVYVNRGSSTRQFEDTVEFTVSNTISWSIEGTLQLTFGAQTTASLQKMIEAQHNTHQMTKDRGPQEAGQDNEAGTDETYTDQGTATGEAQLSAQLMLGITASVSGSLTTSWTSTSTISGDIAANSRVRTIATQRRAVKQYSYEIPVTFAGFFAVNYDVPAPIQATPPQDYTPPNNTANVVARNINVIDLVKGGYFRRKGTVETVSALAVEHTAFETEAITYVDQPNYKTASK